PRLIICDIRAISRVIRLLDLDSQIDLDTRLFSPFAFIEDDIPRLDYPSSGSMHTYIGLFIL
ncbi:hypothetical protein PISMIDRAFT_647623, partial [Pisolithus microcarpus 441]